MSLADCLKKVKVSTDEKVEIMRLVAANGGDEKAGVQAYIDGLLSDIEDARGQLADLGYDVALPEQEGAEPEQEPAEAPQIAAEPAQEPEAAPAAMTPPDSGTAAPEAAERVAGADLENPASWVIREKGTGRVIREVTEEPDLPARGEYEAVPIAQHLAELNQDTPAARMAGQPAPLSGARVTDIPYDTALNAYRNTSFSPERRARQSQIGYVDDVETFAEEMMKKAVSEPQKAEAVAQIATYKDGYRKRLLALLGAQSRTVSPMITGPANFPTARNQKALNTEDKRRTEFLDYVSNQRARAISAIERAATPEQKAETVAKDYRDMVNETIGALRAIENGEPYSRDAFVTGLAGKLRRRAKNGEVNEVKAALDYLEEQQGKFLKKPVFSARNSIWQLRDMEAPAQDVTGGEAVVAQYDGAKITRDNERVRIHFDGKPDEAVRTEMKKHGWRWSRANSAWQRKATNAAQSSAERIVGQFYDRTDVSKDQRQPGAVDTESADQRRPGDPTARMDQRRIAALMPDLRKRLDKMGLKRVALGYDPDMPAQARFTADGQGNMAITIGAALDPDASVRHEGIHALRNMGLFTDKEWAALTSEAEKVWLKKYDIANRYGDLSTEAQIEEAIAEAFGAYEGRAPNDRIKSAFAKVKRFFRALREALTGQGITSVEDIFGDVESGAVGRRGAAGSMSAMEADQTAYHGSPHDAAVDVVSKEQRQPRASHQPQRIVYRNLQNANMTRFGRMRQAAGDRMDQIRIELQDRYLPMLRTVQEIEAQTGQKVPDALHPYRTEEQMPGKVGRDLDDIEEFHTQPIIDALARDGGVTVEGAGIWLAARHAKERNARIAKINPTFQQGEGAGMTDAQAQQILDHFATNKQTRTTVRLQDVDVVLDPSGQQQQDTLAKVGLIVDDMRERTLRMKVDAGLLSKADADVLRKMYQHYVPLKGFAETDNADASLDVSGIGRRLNVKGPESKRALGRRSLAFNPLVAAVTQAQEAAIRAGKNRVGNSFYDLAVANPSPKWDVRQVKQQRVFNKATGMVEYRNVDPANTPLRENEFATKVDGKEYRIEVHDPQLARALGNVGSQTFGIVTQGLMKFSRYFSAVNTMLNPEFMITNALRDLTTAEVNIQGFGEQQRNKLAKAMVKNWRKAFMGALRGMHDTNSQHPWAKEFRKYEDAGGKVSFWQIEDPNKASADLARRVRRQSSLRGKARNLISFSTRDNPVLREIERVNLAVDNAIRLAAFVEARKLGWSEQKAASLAKNLTVNFNRRGEMTPILNGLYPFFNAAVQGTHILLTAMKYKRPRRIVAALVAMGLIEDTVNSWLSEEDDDGELAWDKVQDWKLRRNILFNADGENPWSLPLPYGYNVFPYIGKQIGKVSRGVKDPGDAIGDILATMIESVSPISGSGLDEALIPTIGKPFYEVATNESLFTGRNIAPPKWSNDQGLPDAYNSYRSTPEFWKEVSNIMNRATGGSTIEPGLADVSPDVLEHLFGFVTGGAGRFADRTIDLAIKMGVGDAASIEMKDIPFARQLKYRTGPWLDRERFYTFKGQVTSAINRTKVARDTGATVSAQDAALAKMKQELRATEKKLKELREQKYAIYDQGGSYATRNAALTDIQDQETEIYLDFNRQFLEITGPQGE